MQTLVVSLAALGYPVVRSMKYFASERIVYELRDVPPDLSLPQEGWDVLPEILRELLESHSAGGALFRSPSPVEAAVLDALGNANVSVCISDKYMLRDPGLILTSFVLKDPKDAAGIRPDLAIADYNIWELALHLELYDWKPLYASKEERPLPYDPFDPGAVKAWYSLKDDTRIKR